MINSKRKALKVTASAGLLIATLPARWGTPLINSIVLPAHAQTSSVSDCSGFDTEPVDQAILITVTATEVRGPIVISRNGDTFSNEQTVALGECSDNTDALTQITELRGTIEADQNRMVGIFNLRQYCGEVLVCEQITDFVLFQTPTISGNEQGEYQGRVIGTLRCCRDFL